MKQVFTIFISIFFFSLSLSAQDSLAHSNKRNTIRWDPTPMVLLGPKSIVVGYERIINPNQSISFNIGTLIKKPFTNEYGEEIHFLDESNTGGFLASLDYRFYPKNRNKRLAPDGIYWGPYVSYYGMWFDGTTEFFKDGVYANTVGVDAKLGIMNAGMQLGYQFVIKKRFTIDLVLMGPSYSYYKINIGYDAAVGLDEDSDFYKDLQDYLERISPGLSTILDSQQLTSSGKLDFSFYGFRYLVQFGYRF